MKKATASVCLTALICVIAFFLISPVRNLDGAETISIAVGGGVDLPFSKGDTYSSSAPLVVSVSLSGRVTGLTPGAAQVTRASSKGVSLFDVTVEGVPVTSIAPDTRQMYLSIGETRQILVTLNEDATDKRVRYSSTDESVALADENGNVTGCGRGNCKISCSAMNGLRALIDVTVE